MLKLTATGYKFAVPAAPVHPPAPDLPWWDIKGHALEATHAVIDLLKTEIISFFSWLGHQAVDFLAVILPTLACAGILLWMCPFLPWSAKGPRVTGAALIVYMFFILAKGA